MTPKMLLAAAFVQRQHFHSCHSFVKHAVVSCRTRAMTISSSDSDAIVDSAGEGKRFFEMEQRNWEQGFAAYDEGFGPLTRQTIPTLLSDGGFLPSNIDDDRQFKLLDVATGPGFVLTAAIDAAMKLDLPEESFSNFQFTGLDITQNFLQMANQRINAQLQEQQHKQQQQVTIDFVEGSAESLPFDDGSFDSIVCNFGILHFFHPDRFLSESYRVLRPGGRLSFSAWAPPTRTEGFRIALESIAEVGNPNVEGLPDGPNFFDFGDSNQATNALKEIGFVDTRSVELSEMKWTSIKNGSELYDVLLQGTSRTREILLGQTEEDSAAIASLMIQKYDAITDSGKRSLAMPALITSGCKPTSV
eukprot:scaffold186_cov129-Skeletonema_menzelii.AAC.7